MDFREVTNKSLIEASELFVAPADLSASSTLLSTSASTSGGSIVAIDEFVRIDLAGTPETVQITRWKGLSVPVEVGDPLPTSTITVEEGTVNGFPAIFLKQGGPGSINEIWFTSDDVVTFIRAAAAFDDVLRLAATLATMAPASSPSTQ
jgi:hypothetical protein